jgi:energy-coupling factor transporter ATP-binding protein EcfA2
MDRLQHKNLQEIEGLNQRGGRTLSFVDLIACGTLSAELVAYCWAAIAHGASFLTAARPGGAGKSTILANLLCLLPPAEEIVTVTNPQLVAPEARRCWLAHEIGAGHWYGYIWGRQVPDFMGRTADGQRIASCLHADTLSEVHAALLKPPLSVPQEAFNALDLILFIHVTPGFRRRVVEVHESTVNGHRLVFSWDEATDRISQCGDSELLARLRVGAEEVAARLASIQEIIARGDERFETVRAQVLAAY